jgi:uncharacterized RDD family membrane protein YckC
MKPATIEMTPTRALLLVVAVTWIATCAAPRAARAAPDDLLAEGAGEQLWTAQVVPNADKNLPGQRTVLRVRGAGESERWRQVAEIAAPAVALTHRGGELVVLLESGEWRFVAESGVRSGDRLPGNQPVLAIAGNGETLWAVGEAGETPPATTPASTTTRAATGPTTATAAQVERATTTTTTKTAPVAATSPAPRILYRLDRGAWMPVVPLPSRLIPEAGPIAMAVIDGKPLIAAFVPDGSLRTVQLADGNAWLDRGTIRAPFKLHRFELLPFRGRATLWTAGETGAGVVYELTNAWKGPVELRTKAPFGPEVERALAVAFGRLRLLYAGGDRTLYEQTFNADGVPDSEPTQGQVQALPPDPRIAQLVQLGVMVLLMFVMLSTLRRRGSLQEAMRKADKLPLAPLVPRFLAGMIDALPLIAVPAFIVFTSASLDDAKLRMNDTVIQAWEGGAAIVYIAYTAAAEMLFARTLGKWLLRMRVANLDGSRPTARALFLRNLMRLVDLTLALFPLVMVFLSPLRQRIGDVAAGTIVVRADVVTPPRATDSFDKVDNE